ncbi:unnamed protein product, partial [Ectocarpus sp. 4 AP-2014]
QRATCSKTSFVADCCTSDPAPSAATRAAATSGRAYRKREARALATAGAGRGYALAPLQPGYPGPARPLHEALRGRGGSVRAARFWPFRSTESVEGRVLQHQC